MVLAFWAILLERAERLGLYSWGGRSSKRIDTLTMFTRMVWQRAQESRWAAIAYEPRWAVESAYYCFN